MLKGNASVSSLLPPRFPLDDANRLGIGSSSPWRKQRAITWKCSGKALCRTPAPIKDAPLHSGMHFLDHNAVEARSRDEGRLGRARALWARGSSNKPRCSVRDSERHRRTSNYSNITISRSLAPNMLRPRKRDERISRSRESAPKYLPPNDSRDRVTLRIIETLRGVPSNCPREGDGSRKTLEN